MSDFLDRIGKLSPKRLALLALEQHEQIEAAARRGQEPIAIIGVGCRFPGGVSDPESYWQLLHQGRDAICDVPSDRWDADALFDPDPDAPAKMSVRNGGFLADAGAFDPAFFGIAPREALTMDPQQRLLLEVTWQALEHAGIAPESLAGSATGVFVGICNSDYFKRLLNRSADSIDAYFASGNAPSVASGRIAYCLGLQGPALSIDTACSSSLVALHVACRSLRSGESRVAIAAGVNLMASPETTIALSKSHMLAPDGRCKTFDASADGFARGEGCGVLILKGLKDAVADGDRVLAVIRGTAVNQDGRSGGLTVPNGPAQEAVIRTALADAGVQPEDINYVEAHGTGTSLGDPIEVHALGGALCGARSAENPLLIGSVKTNFGHLESAAGIAGVIKVVLALQNERIPAHLHFSQPSPHIAWDRYSIKVTAEGAQWPRGSGRRLAGVSSFGFSGTNAHVVIEEAALPQATATPEHRPLHCLPLSAKSSGALTEVAQRYTATFAAASAGSFLDLINTAGVGRSHLSERAAIVAGTPQDTAVALDALRLGKSHPAVHRGTALTGQPTEVVFLFTGQGSQYAGMTEQLYAGSPVFRDIIDQCDRLLGADTQGRTLKSVLWSSGADAAINETGWTQPALFAVEYGVAQVWRSWGVEPAAVLGHSVGEYAAACVAGVFTLEEGLRLIAARGRLMQTCASGRMAAVFTSPAEATAAVASVADRVSVAAINAADSVVISGDSAAVDEILQGFARRDIRGQALAVSIAAHSPLVDPILDAMQNLAAGVVMRAPRIPVAWNLTGGKPLPGGAAPDAGYWRRHLREPVRFADGVSELYRQGMRTFLEVGPHPTLIALAQRSLPEDRTVSLMSSLRRGREDWAEMLGSLARLYVGGARIDWARVNGPYGGTRRTLPSYPFERGHYWVTPPAGRTVDLTLNHGKRDALRAARLATAAPLFQTTLTPTGPAYLADHRVHGAMLVAAGVFLELAQSCAHEGRDKVPQAIADFTIAEPMVLTEGGRVIEVNLSAGEAGRFEISSRPVEDQSAWTAHVSGRFVEALRASPAAEPTLAELRARLGRTADCDAHYKHLAGLGIDLSGVFRSLREAHCGDGEVLTQIALAPGEADTCCWAHPGLIDGALQSVGLAVADLAGADELALITGMERAQLYGRLPPTLWCHARIRDAAQGGAALWLADATLRGADGAVIGVLQGVRLQRASRAALQRLALAGTTGTPNTTPAGMFYEVDWEESAAVAPGAASLAAPRRFEASLRPEFDRLAVQHGMAVYGELLPELDRLCSDHIVTTLLELGFDDAPGRRFSATTDAARLGVLPRHGRLFGRMLDMLVEDGLLTRHGSGPSALLETAKPFRRVDPLKRYEALLSRFKPVDGELLMLRRCASHLRAVLTGAQDPLQLLFPGGSLQEARQIYIESPFARTYNSALAFALQSAMAGLATSARLRVLEIGAGTGGTTSYLMSLLKDRADYTFTDVSALFLEQAEQRFAEHPFMRYSLFDVERDPVAQDLKLGEYDVVIAANVLHATADLRRAVDHARSLLAPGGMLILLEGVGPERWVDLTFGMTEGWWRFADSLRTDYPLISRDAWRGTLEQVGFDDVAVFPDGAGLAREIAQQALLVARLPVLRRSWVIVGNPDGCGTALVEQLRARGESVTLTDVAAIDGELPLSGELIYLGALGLVGRDTSGSDAIPACRELACERPVQWLARAAQTNSNLRTWLVTRGAQSVAGEMLPSARWQAPLWGVGRVFALEHPRNWGGVLDLPPQATPSACATMVLSSVDALGSEDQIAWRSNKRFVSRLQAVSAPAAASVALQGDATYLITGGFGGLGLLVALWMAQHGARHIALLGRHPDTNSQVIKDIEATGARVIALAGDVADEASMQANLARLAQEAPRLAGIVHAAADLSVAPIAVLSSEQIRAMMRPKIEGLLLMERLTRSVQLDFVVLFSSTTALLGASGYAHYAAANAFLDATALTLDRPGRRVVSVNWGTWQAMRLASAESQRSYREAGLEPMPAADALQALGLILSGERAQTVVAQIDWKILKPLHEARRPRPLLARFGDAAVHTTGVGASEDDSLQAALVSRLAGADPSQRAEIVTEWVQDEASVVLGLTDARSVPLEQGLFEMGMDSLMSVELRKRLERGIGSALPATLTFNYPNIAALSTYLQRQLAGSTTATPVAAAAAMPAVVSDDLDSLDDDELESRLRARLEAMQ